MIRNLIWGLILLPLALFAVYDSLRINTSAPEPRAVMTETRSLQACAAALEVQQGRFGAGYKPSSCEAAYPSIKDWFTSTTIEYSSGRVVFINGQSKNGQAYQFDPQSMKR